ncbi:MAG: hypothetical protein GX621_00095 [Pirellulaceae bacterium]|nr:hypothetical protein [Pirellulaceae bacterium]
MSIHKKRLIVFGITCMIAVTAMVGCGKTDTGTPRVDVRGSVTWKGRPVPAGYVLFSPDASRNNSGPQGMATIVDGAYDTRGADGRAPVPGPVIVTINGFDGGGGGAVDEGEGRPRGSRLFMPYEMPIVVPEAAGALNLEVPDNAVPVR